MPWISSNAGRAKVPKMQPASTGSRRPVTNRGCPRGNGTMESPDLKDDNGLTVPGCCQQSLELINDVVDFQLMYMYIYIYIYTYI